MFKNYGDITKINGSLVEEVDCIIGGSPCQNLSVAGNREGLEGSESCLFLEQMRLVKEMRLKTNNLKPRYMIWENVVNALSCSKGKDFQRVLMECLDVIYESGEVPIVPMPKDGKWSKSGILYDDLGRWSIAWRVHDAQYWGVAQRRRRIALVVDFGGMSAPEVLFESKSVQRDSDTCNPQGEGVAETSVGSLEESDRIWDARGNGNGHLSATITGDHDNRIMDYTNVVVHRTPICIGNGQSHITNHYTVELSQTLNCMHDPMTILEPVQSYYCVRRLTPLECTRLQGFPDGWVNIGDWVDSKGKKHKDADAPKYKALGNSIALPFWKWLCKNIVKELQKNNQTTTMASLFDGIGGFPLCWTEATGNKEDVLWISEIEEFPLAVTRHHFG